MRELTDYKGSLANDGLDIRVMDEPGAGGANHQYAISTPHDPAHNGGGVFCEIDFQNGLVPEVGVNGVTEQALLAVVLDRLRAFQSGPFSSRENAIAITNIEQGLMWLRQRTRNREERGVEGTLQK